MRFSACVIRPSAEECIKNGRARSTKLRWAIGDKVLYGQLTAGGFCRRRREACKMDMEQLSLFDTEAVYDPLASRMRPGGSG